MSRSSTFSPLARSRTRQFRDYSIVFFCPLIIEQHAACLMLDEIHDDEPPRNVNQTIIYTFGRIASFNVAIAAYPGGEAGIGISGSMVAEAQRDFGKSLEHGILVGIGAGLPSSTRDIRLGDVAVAFPNKACPGIVGYDLKKVEETGEVLKQWQEATDSLLRGAMSKLQVHEARQGHDFRRHLLDWKDHPKFRRPPSRAMSTDFLESPAERPLDDDSPKVHYGTILSGNGVIKSKAVRDELRDKWDAIALEMEAAGMTTRLRIGVIRGISDFADSRKNDDWHAYAALAAAAYAKEVVIKLGSVQTEEQGNSPESVISSHLDVCLSRALPPSSDNFVGRETEISRLMALVDNQSQRAYQADVLAVSGLGGTGKSYLVAEFVRRLRQLDDSLDVFWVSGETRETFEQSLARFLKDSQSPMGGSQDNYSEQRAIQVNSFFAELGGVRNKRWLLIIDGLSSDSEVQNHIFGHLQRLINGCVILTTRSRPLLQRFPACQSMEVKGLSEDDAVKFMENATVYGLPSQLPGLRELARVLNSHPLSLRLAASSMNHHLDTADEYVGKWKRRELVNDPGFSEESLSRCFQLSLAEIEARSFPAFMALMLFAYLDHSDMWLDMCKKATEDDDLPEWLRQVACQQPQKLYYLLKSLSFVEPKRQGPGADLIWEIHPAIHEFCRQRAKSLELEEELVQCAVSLVAAKVPRSQDRNFHETARRLTLHAEQCKIYLDQNRAGGVVDLFEMKKFGDLFRLVGRFDDACQFYEHTLERLKYEATLDDDDLELMANLQNNLGLVQHHKKDHAEAITQFEESRQTYFMIRPEENSATMSSLYNIGRSLMVGNELDAAMRNLDAAAAFFKPCQPLSQSLGHDGPEATPREHFYYRILNDLGEIYLRQNDIEKAERTLEMAYEGQSKYLGEDHPSVFPIRLNMGRICVLRDRFDVAKKIFQYILSTYIGWWGRRHPESMRAIEELADAQTEHGAKKRRMGDDGEKELTEAHTLMTEVAKFHADIYGEDSNSARLTLSKLQALHELIQKGLRQDDYYSKYYTAAEIRRSSAFL